MRKLFAVLLMAMVATTANAQTIAELTQKAQNGDVDAMLRLATRYERGWTVDQDSAVALGWIQQGVALENADAYARIVSYYTSARYLAVDSAKAFSMAQQSATKGSRAGISMLAYCYEAGIGVEKDTMRAVTLYQQAADRGDARGLYNLAWNYYFGEMGFSKNTELALQMATQATKADPESIYGFKLLLIDNLTHNQNKKAVKVAKQGVSRGSLFCEVEYYSMMFSGIGMKRDEAKAQQELQALYNKFPQDEWLIYRLSGMYIYPQQEELKNYSTAVNLLQLSANRGSSIAQTMLGESYLYGNFTEVSEEKALKYYSMAAEQGDSDGEFFTAILLINDTTKDNSERAMELLNRSSNQKNANAAQLMSQLYAEGRIVEQDFNESRMWLTKSVEWGNTKALLSLGEMEMEQNPVLAKEYFQRAVESGNGDGYYYLALMEPDDKAKIKLLEKGVKLNSGVCSAYLGLCYEDGVGTKVDNKKAAQYYSKSENAFAYNRLGLMYLQARVGKGDSASCATGVDYLQQSANMGNSEAYYRLGYVYRNGVAGVPANLAKSKEYFQVLADNDNSDGQFELAYIYENGLGVEFDSTLMIHYYLLSSQNGNSEAMCYLGDYFRAGKYVGGVNCEYASELFRQSAELGNSGGYFYMGRSYLEGCGVVKDTMLAMPWLWKAAAMNEGGAMEHLAEVYNYGSMSNGDSAFYYYMNAAQHGSGKSGLLLGNYYMAHENYKSAVDYYYLGATNRNSDAIIKLADCMREGIGFKAANPEESYDLYKIASTYNNDEAYVRLGAVTMRGEGCVADPSLAKSYFDTAASMGNRVAMYNLYHCYKNGMGCDADSAIALRWLKTSADKDYISAINTLAECYQYGNGAPKDENRAFELYSRGVQLGSLSSLCSLGYCYETGSGVVLNSEKAFELYKQAAESGYAHGWFLLGMCYIDAIYVDENNEEAFACFEKAAALGHVRAIYNLAQMYENGDGVKKDLKQAKKYYKMAADAGLEAADAALNRLK